MAGKSWCSARELKLIELVKEIPALWNSNLDKYKISEQKSLKWLAIADELKTTSGWCSIVLCHTLFIKLLNITNLMHLYNICNYSHHFNFSIFFFKFFNTHVQKLNMLNHR